MLVEMIFQRVQFVIEGHAGRYHPHPNNLRQPAIHRIRRHRPWIETVSLTKVRQFRQKREPAQHGHVCVLPLSQHFSCRRNERPHVSRRPLGLIVERPGFERHDAYHLRVSLTYLVVQLLAVHNQHKTIILHRIHLDIHSRDLNVIEHLHKRRTLGCRYPPCPSVHDIIIFVHRAKIAARRQVTRPELHVNTQRLQHTAPHEIFHRVVSEECHMTGPASRRDSRHNRHRQPGRAAPRQIVQIWQISRFEFRFSRFRMGRAAKPIYDKQHDL